MKITIHNEYTDETKRYDLSTMKQLDYSTNENHGVSVEGAFYGPRSQRIIVQLYSIWEGSRHDGTVVGRFFEVHEPGDDQYLIWWERLGLDKIAKCPIAAEQG